MSEEQILGAFILTEEWGPFTCPYCRCMYYGLEYPGPIHEGPARLREKPWHTCPFPCMLLAGAKALAEFYSYSGVPTTQVMRARILTTLRGTFN